MTRKEYANVVRRRGRIACLAFLAVLLICLALTMALFRLVQAGPTRGIPEPVSDYLLHTGPLEFSSTELRRLVAVNPSSEFSATTLLLVYWVYFAAVSLVGVILAVAPLLRRLRLLRRKPWERGIIETRRIESGLLRFAEKESLASKLALLRAVYRPRLYSLVSPLRKAWYKEAEHQWLQPGALDRETRSILSTLRRFDESLLRAVSLNLKLDQLIEATRLLSEFFFAVASRSDPVLQHTTAPSRNAHTTERELLARFSAVARPAVIEVARAARKQKRSSRAVALASGILRARIVRGAATVSTVAAGVMILGYVLFEIPKTQAFLTWFTVTFGSLSISVGVESFRISRDPSRAEADAEREQ